VIFDFEGVNQVIGDLAGQQSPPDGSGSPGPANRRVNVTVVDLTVPREQVGLSDWVFEDLGYRHP
jgi:hypothetical protein